MKKIAILGSTGSIGTQTLEIVRTNGDLEVTALAAGNNIDLLEKQIREFKPKLAAVWKEERANELKDKINEYLKSNIDMINESVILVFVENEVEKNSIYNTIEKIGTVCNFEEQKPFQIIKRLKAICNSYKVNVDESTLQYLIESCGTNMQDLINEIRKLIEYAGENGKIQKQDIDKLCIKKRQNRFIPGSAFSFLYSFFHTVQLFAIFPSLAFPILLLSIFHTGISPILLSFQF